MTDRTSGPADAQGLANRIPARFKSMERSLLETAMTDRNYREAG